MSGNEEVSRREVAHRLFAAEFEDATLDYKESDEERAPNYVVTPTGARVNRMFVVGVLTELEQVNDNVLRARIVDPTGAFVVYAGQYQPDELAFLERVDPPAFLAITGKARTFQPEDSDRVFTSIRPESINRVDAETRDRWIVGTAEQTIERVATMATALERPEAGEELESLLVDAGATPEHANGIRLALEHYGTTPEYLAAIRDLAIEATETVAGEREEVAELAVAPGEGDGSVTVDDLPEGLGELPAPETTGSATADDTGAGEPDILDEPAESGTEVTAGDDDPVTASEDTVSETGDEASEDATDESVTETPDEEPDDTTGEPETVDEESDESVTADDVLSGSESVGNFETGTDAEGTGSDETAAASDDTGPDQDADSTAAESDDSAGTGEMYEFSEDEREEIEEEYGTEFSTGTEVPEPGEADIETPDPDELDEPAEEDGKASEDVAATETDVEPATEDENPDGSETEDDPGAEDDDRSEDDDDEAGPGEGKVNIPDDVTLTDVVIETMQELDDGDGVDRYDLIDAVIEDTGMTEPDVKDAIEEALMGGRCYEPTDDTLKPI
ncbi:hypothetical protein [Natranaeroarchaeum aerophilus]|uniref:Rpa-associated protein n=1 Tax=Natranaeroarchaeum aerophilus TaxID=2917711 RepID=A0AAE3FQX2_9EURY|nr:hypothetical protein [Natranaeroarchaeum aerophilus]MCL9812989.1 hypothetical protein [Natranaeroarchaeum aerophilus]